MKLLYLGFNRRYINRTSEVLLNSLARDHDLLYYGPGYVSPSELELGPEAWCDLHGPFDIVLFDSYVLEWDSVARRGRPFVGDYLMFPASDFYRWGMQLQAFAISTSGAKIFIANWDTYGISENQISLIYQASCFVLDSQLGTWTIAEKEEIFGQPIQGFEGSGFWSRANDNWITFLKANRKLVLSIPHAIGTDQFCETPTAARPDRLAIPGTSYPERKNLYPLLTATQRAVKLARAVQDRVYFLRHDSLTLSKMQSIHARYDGDITRARLAYVSGWLFRSPVRKYLEVPALGAAPVGQRCEGFKELGFADRQSFIVAESSSDVETALNDLDVEYVQQVASQARRMVEANHSGRARADQLSESIRRIVSGSFFGSYWQDGSYCHW